MEMALGFGGSGKSLTELIGALDDVDPFVLSEFAIGPHMPSAIADRVTVVAIPRARWLGGQPRIAGYVHTAQRVTAWARAIAQAARANHVQVIHANNGVAQNLPAIIAGRLAGVPVVVHQRGWEDARRMLSIARGLGSSARVIAISDAVREQLVALRFDSTRISRIYDVILPPARQPLPKRSDGVLRVGMHSVLTPWKGHRTFLAAAAILHAQSPGAFHFDIAGSDLDPTGAFRRELGEQASALGLQDALTFSGHVSDVYGWLANIDVSVHASLTDEPLGRVIAEAQLARRPVVAARGGGANELVDDGVTGLLVDPGSAELLAQAVDRMRSDPDLRARIADSGWGAARARFDVTTLAAEVRQVYDAAVGSYR